MDFAIIAETFQKMEATTKRTELTSLLVELIKNTPNELIAKAVYLLQGILKPSFEGLELGIAEKLAIRAIAKSSGISVKKIQNEYNIGGDLGETASNILKLKTQTTFVAEPITLERVYETLLKIANLSPYISCVVSSCTIPFFFFSKSYNLRFFGQTSRARM